MFRRKRMLQQLDDEIREHIETETQDNIERGMSPEEARYAAVRKFGNVTRVKEETREVWSFVWLEQLWQDIRYGARMLRRSPGFTFVAILTLAVGIGASGAIFSVVDGALLHPFIYKHSERSAVLVAQLPYKNLRSLLLSIPEYLEIKNRNHVFDQLGAEMPESFDLSDRGTPEFVFGARLTANEFSARGVPPLLGRVFSPEEDRPGGPRVALIAFTLWGRRFNSDPNIVGESIRLNGAMYTILGVMPPRYRVLGGEIFLPAQLDTADSNRSHRFLYVVGNLRPEVSLDRARSELSALAHAMEREHGGSEPEYARWSLEPVLIRDAILGNLEPALFALMGAVAFVLLMISANLSNLLLARGAARRQELTLRLLHGASRSRILRQVLTENLFLSFLGALAGSGLLYFGLHALVALIPPEYIAAEAEIVINPEVLLFVASLTILLTVLFGLGPTLQATHWSASEALAESGRGIVGTRSGTFTRAVLITAEITLAFVVLVGASLMFATYRLMSALPLGFRSDHILTMRVPLSEGTYPRAADVEHFYEELLRRVRTLPGGQDAAVTSFLPMEEWDFDSQDFVIEGRSLEKGGTPNADVSITSPGFFRTFAIGLLEGRTFADDDRPGSAPVAIINEKMARLFWPNQSPLGHRISLGFTSSRSGRLADSSATSQALTIVGVVADTRQRPDLLYQIRPEIYLPYWQNVGRIRNMALAVRTLSAPSSLAGAVRAQVQALGPQQPVYRIEDMDTIVANGMGPKRLSLVLLGLFAVLALLLVIVGLYGVIAYSISRRTHELGVRIAMGAQPRDILQLVLKETARLTISGLATGLILAVLCARLAAAQFYGVSPTDPVALVGVAVLLLAVAFVAGYIPARRAMRVDPMVALRYE
jgi:predicted permease